MYYSRFRNLCQIRTILMFWAPFELEFGLNHLRLEWRIFLEQDTVSPMFGLCERERENLRFHVSIIADSLFIVNFWCNTYQTSIFVLFDLKGHQIVLWSSASYKMQTTCVPHKSVASTRHCPFRPIYPALAQLIPDSYQTSAPDGKSPTNINFI